MPAARRRRQPLWSQNSSSSPATTNARAQVLRRGGRTLQHSQHVVRFQRRPDTAPHRLQAARAQPVQAALASAASFAVGAALPLAVAALTPESSLIGWAVPNAGSNISLAYTFYQSHCRAVRRQPGSRAYPLSRSGWLK